MRVRRANERTRILAVDDDPQTLRYLQRSLNEAGYQPIVTADAAQVARLVELEDPDLVLLDLMLPGTNGYELLHRIREFSGGPVLFLTARNRDEDMVPAMKMGADDYIAKPFSPSELLAHIEVSLRRRWSRHLLSRWIASPSWFLLAILDNLSLAASLPRAHFDRGMNVENRWWQPCHNSQEARIS